jgi:hypothetical protein
MDTDIERLLRLIHEVAATADLGPGPVELSPWFRDAVRHIANLPQNQSGADKSWVPCLERESAELFRKARLLPPGIPGPPAP